MSPVLEVLIGMIFIFSLLSVLVTQVNAVVSQVLRLRAQYLFDTVKQLLHDHELTARFVTHPLIKIIDFSDVEGLEKWSSISSNQELTDEQVNRILEAKLNGIEWIEAKQFSNVLMSLVRVENDHELFSVLDDIATQMDDRENRLEIRRLIQNVVDNGVGISELVDAINALPPGAHKRALVERMRDINKEIGDKGLKTDINVALVAGVRKIKDQYLKKAIHTILTTSKTLEEVEAKLTNWYDQTMAKTTEKFKQRMKMYSYLIGLLIAIIANVDAMHIGLTLWEDPVLRTTVATTAQTVNLSNLEAIYEEANSEIDASDPTTLEEVRGSIADAVITVNQLQDLRIPIGWDFSDLSAVLTASPNDYRLRDSRYFWNFIPGNNPDFLFLLARKMLGIAATMLAVGQGAPFWFNLLRQFR